MDHERLGTGLRGDVLWLSALACVVLVVHFAVGNGYGFHRDELQFLDDARHLHWGFTAYPPMTAFAGRVAIALFGISPQVFRLPAAVLNAVSLVLMGLTARELGGGRLAQVLALAAGLPVALALSSMMQYTTPDFLAWTLMTFFTAKLLRTGDERWWVGVGAAAGFGVLSKYAIAFPVAGLMAGLILLPSQRRHLRSGWFWAGVGVGFAVCAPNLIWLARHHFITLTMESSIHARDVRQGRAEGYFTDQLKFTLLAFPLAVAGLVSLLRSERFRLLSAFYLGPLVLFAMAKGRGYYLLPGYVALYAAGAVGLQRWLARRGTGVRVVLASLAMAAMVLDSVAISGLFEPVAKPGSKLWNYQMANSGDLRDEIGWPEFVKDVADVRDGLAPEERDRMAVLAENYGEAGALALYGPQYGLPVPIAGVNSFHDRGYGPFAPENVIVTGGTYNDLLKNFESCRAAGKVHIPFGVRNEEAVSHPDIFVCHHLRSSWDAVWPKSQHFG